MLKPNFTPESFRKELEKRILIIRKQIIDRLILLGDECLIEARNNRGYMDQSGNLAASTGYVIVDHGNIIKVTGFNKDSTNQGNTDVAEGVETGRVLAETLAKKAPKKGYALIMVAGMHYADYVESQGNNVLASAELFAERRLPGLLQRLKTNIAKMN